MPHRGGAATVIVDGNTHAGVRVRLLPHPRLLPLGEGIYHSILGKRNVPLLPAGVGWGEGEECSDGFGMFTLPTLLVKAPRLRSGWR